MAEIAKTPTIPLSINIIPSPGDTGRQLNDYIKRWDEIYRYLGADLAVLFKGLVSVSNITDTPYDILDLDSAIFANTDSSDVVLNLPKGVNGKQYRIINVGSSGNIVTLNPDGTENLIGENSSVTLDDTEALIITYSDVEGWW